MTTKKSNKAYLCKYCGETNKDEFYKDHITLCKACKIDKKISRRKEEDKEKRLSAIKLMTEETKTRSVEDEVTYSEVKTGTLIDLVADIRNLITDLKYCKKKIEKLEKKIEKLESK